MNYLDKRLIKIVILSLVIILWGSVQLSTGKTNETIYLDASNVYVSEDVIYCSSGEDLVMISPANNVGPWTATVIPLTGDLGSVMKQGNKIYAGVKNTGLCILEINTDGTLNSPIYLNLTKNFPPDILNVQLNARPMIFIKEKIAFLGYEGMGLAIVNMADLMDPEEPIVEYESKEVFNVYVSGNHVFLAERMKLIIMDISSPMDPGNPIYVDTDSETMDIWVVDNYAYIADFYWGLAIVDISDPSNPGELVEKETGGQTRSICVANGFAYLIDGNSGLVIIDVTDPTNPGDPISEYYENNWKDVYVDGDYAYVATGSEGIAVFDVSDPTNPSEQIYIKSIAQTTYFTEQGTNVNLWKSPGGSDITSLSDSPTAPEISSYSSVGILIGLTWIHIKRKRDKQNK